MHTAIVMGSGLAVLALMIVAGRAFGQARRAALLFIPLWFVAAAVNMWIGVARAGYAWTDEAPIFLVVFGAPAAIAWVLSRRL